MPKNVIITEEQYNIAMQEGINLTADVAASNGDVKAAIDKTKQTAKKEIGNDLSDVTISVPAKDTNESRVITKRELINNRRRALKENSEVYSLRNFLKSIKR
jgi:hypothetical protein